MAEPNLGMTLAIASLPPLLGRLTCVFRYYGAKLTEQSYHSSLRSKCTYRARVRSTNTYVPANGVCYWPYSGLHGTTSRPQQWRLTLIHTQQVNSRHATFGFSGLWSPWTVCYVPQDCTECSSLHTIVVGRRKCLGLWRVQGTEMSGRVYSFTPYGEVTSCCPMMQYPVKDSGECPRCKERHLGHRVSAR